jgi:hypothetical protein
MENEMSAVFHCVEGRVCAVEVNKSVEEGVPVDEVDEF